MLLKMKGTYYKKILYLSDKIYRAVGEALTAILDIPAVLVVRWFVKNVLLVKIE